MDVFVEIDKINLDINIDKNDVDNNNDVDEIDVDKIDVDKTDVDKIDVDKPHNGRPITEIKISPNEKYLVTYSLKDSSVVGWNVEGIDEGQLKLDNDTVKISKYHNKITSLCVSDDKKLAYIYGDDYGDDYDDYDDVKYRYSYGK